VLAYDAPAHGASPGRRSSLPELAFTVSDVGRSVGPLAAVVAHSLGATAVLRASARGELAARRLVLLAPSVDMDLAAERFRVVTGFTRPVIDRMWTLFQKQFGFAAEELEVSNLASGIRGRLSSSTPRTVTRHGRRQLTTNAAEATRLLTTRGLGHRKVLRSPEVVEAVTRFIAEESGSLETPIESGHALQGGMS
jgi:pimeloyl-ACP methyl ester carboxylesterase